MDKKKYFTWVFSVGIVLVGALIMWQEVRVEDLPEEKSFVIEFYSDPNCSCCKEYVSYLKQNNFEVNINLVSESQLIRIKGEGKIPQEAWSCHTFKIGKYYFEGHIPVEGVRKVLNENPDVDGIALPGMPPGSPGMGGIKESPFTIYSFKDNEMSIYYTI